MAEGVVTVVAEGIKTLGDFMIQQAKFLSGVSYQVELAQVELHLIRGFLRDADARQGDEEVVRIWVKLVRDTAYDLEDVIESFALNVALKRRGGTVKIVLKRFACIFNEGVHRYKIGSEIEDIMNKLSHLRLSLQNYNIRQISGGEGVASSIKRKRDRRLTYGHQVESHVVGIEENTDILVKELVREGKRHRVVSIWGMGGSGKTTLAKQVFLQDEVKRHFDCFAWLCISQQWEGKDVLEEILVKLTSAAEERKEQIAKMRKDEIAEKLCSFQRGKRCLVILDDLWTQEAWHSLKAGFPVNEETESRILLTTRNKEVALLASRNDFLHEPRPLDEKQSWELFEKIAICEGDHTDLEIYAKKTELGKKMLVHCSGFPLAISVLAGLLRRRHTIDEWEMVLRNVVVHIMRGTNVLGRENINQEYGVSGVLALSYDDLPSQLKLCFLYLAQYPEDHEIPVQRLTQLWNAEGFITSSSEVHGSVDIMEDVAYGCLIELVERSMVQVGNYGSSGKVKTCRLHDLMRDLCLQKAKEENFLDVVDFSRGPVSIHARLIGKVRRVALYSDRNGKYEFSGRDGRDNRIRSLLFFSRKVSGQKWNKKVMRSIFSDFRLLRVLKFANIRCRFELPKTIGDLVHLRFLSLRGSAFGELPSSISNLILLQTLDLRSSFHKKSCFGGVQCCKIRNVFRNMEQLRHLYFPYNYSLGGRKLSLGRLHNLQTLVNISMDTCDLNDIVQLTNLKKLGVNVKQSGRLEKLKNVLISASVTFEHLRSLSLAGNNYGWDIPRDVLPEELLSYPNLTKITLVNTRLKGDQIEILEKLPHLRVLKLWYNVFESSETLVFSQEGFPQLEVLSLHYMDLQEWTVEKEALRCLRRLYIEYCQQLRAIPDGIQDVTTLKELTIEGMLSRFYKRVGEGGEDFYKIIHVPSLITDNLEADDKDDEPEMDETAGASQAGDSHQESNVDASPPPDEKTEELQASSTPDLPC